jgi:hypothetical protein
MSGDPIDARAGGASAELIDLLKSAEAVLIGLKDRQTAIVQLTHGDQVRYVVLKARTQRTHAHAEEVAAERPLAIPDAQRDLMWQTAVAALRPGHVITIEWSMGWGGVTLESAAPSEGSLFWDGRRSQHQLGVTAVRQRIRVGGPYVVRGAS